MKKFSLIVVVLICAILGAQNCNAQAKVFKEAAAIEGVTSIYISPLLLKMGGTKSLGHGLDDAVKEIKAFEMIESEQTGERQAKVVDICRKKIASLGCELLMEVNDDEDKVKIYASVPKGSEYADQLIIEVDETGKEYVVIYVKGKIDLQKVMKDKGN